MEKQILTVLIAILMALSGWTMHTTNQLQLEVRSMMVGHASQAEIQELKLAIQRLQWLLQDDAMEK